MNRYEFVIIERIFILKQLSTYGKGGDDASPVDLLAGEQKRLLDLLVRIGSSLNSLISDGFSRDAFSQIADGIRTLGDELGTYHRREERFLFPFIDNHSPGYCGSHRADHRQIRGELERLQRSVSDVESGKLHGTSMRELTAATKEIVDRLRSKFWREQEELFPFAEKTLTEAEQRECGNLLITDERGKSL